MEKGRRKENIRPITVNDFNDRGQVDLVVFQTMADGKFKWVLHNGS